MFLMLLRNFIILVNIILFAFIFLLTITFFINKIILIILTSTYNWNLKIFKHILKRFMFILSFPNRIHKLSLINIIFNIWTINHFTLLFKTSFSLLALINFLFCYICLFCTKWIGLLFLNIIILFFIFH